MRQSFTANNRPHITAQEVEEAVLSGLIVDVTHPVQVEGKLNLSNLSCVHFFRLHGATFADPVTFRDSHFSRTLDLTGCTFGDNVDFSGARIDGDLILTRASIHGGEVLPMPARFETLKVHGKFTANGLRTLVSVHLNGLQVDGDIDWSAQKEQRTVIGGDVKMCNARLKGGLSLEGSFIDGDLDLDVARIDGSLGCSVLRDPPTTNGQPFQRTHIRGMVQLGGTEVGGQIQFNGAQIDGRVNLYAARVRCGLAAYSEKGFVTLFGGDFSASGAKLGDLLLQTARIQGLLELTDAEITGQLACREIQVGPDSPPGGPPLVERLTDAALLTNLKVTGEACFRGARVEGHLNLRNADLKGGLTLQPWENQPALIRGRLLLAGAEVGGPVHLDAAQLAALDLDGATIQGDVTCNAWGQGDGSPGNWLLPVIQQDLRGHAAEVTGRVELLGTQMGRDLALEGARITGNLQLASHPFLPTLIQGNVLLTGSRVTGNADLNIVRVGNNVLLTGSRITGFITLNDVRVGNTVDLSDVIVDGGIFVRGARIGPEPGADDGAGNLAPPAQDNLGTILMRSAKVSGQVSFNGSVIAGTVDTQSAEIKGGLVLRPYQGKPTRIHGKLLVQVTRVSAMTDLNGARIGTEARFDGSVLSGLLRWSVPLESQRDGVASENLKPRCQAGLSLDGAEVIGDIDLRDLEIGGELSLVSARASGTCYFGNLQRSGVFNLEGFQFQNLSVTDDDYPRFVSETQPFSRSTFIRVEKWLRDQNRDDEADKVYIDMVLHGTHEGLNNPKLTAWQRLELALGTQAEVLLRLVGFYVKSWHILLGIMILIGLTWWVFSDSQAVRPAVLNGSAWTCCDGLALAVQTLVPIISFAAPERWQPKALSSDPVPLGLGLYWPFSFATWGTWMTLLGYLAVPLLVARIVALLKRQR